MVVSWNDVFLAIVTVCVVVFAVQLIRALARIENSMNEIARTAVPLGPHLERTLDEASELLKEVRSVALRLDDVAADASSISGEARQRIVPMIRDLDTVRLATRRVSAMTVAVRVGLAALARRGRG